jgi:CRISPR-associated protein Csy1
VRKEVSELREYLKKQRNKKSVKSVRDYRKERIDDLINQLIQYGAEIRDLQDSSGWSALPMCKLPLAEQLWLDPRRTNDEAFALELEKGDWKEHIADQFAHWLNRRLKTKELHFGDVEHREWKSLLEQALRLLKNDLEVFS